MKVIINNIIIDTTDIFKISEIKSLPMWFKIFFFGGTDMIVRIEYKSTEDINETITKFKKGWQELVDLWSNNQTKIPKIEF